MKVTFSPSMTFVSYSQHRICLQLKAEVELKTQPNLYQHTHLLKLLKFGKWRLFYIKV